MTAMLSPMLLFSFHTHASCTPHFIHLHAVHGYALFFFPSILPLPCGHLMFCFSSIPRLCLMHAPNTCCHILSLCWDSSVDLIQTCTYHVVPVYKGCKCQPENFSLVLLVFPLLSQRDHLHNRLLAPSVCSSLSL